MRRVRFPVYGFVAPIVCFKKDKEVLRRQHPSLHLRPAHDSSERTPLQQMQQAKIVKGEMALHYWHSSSTFHDYIVLPVLVLSTEKEARLWELTLIAKWQPPLNYPFCSKLQLRACGVRHVQAAGRHTENISTSGSTRRSEEQFPFAIFLCPQLQRCLTSSTFQHLRRPVHLLALFRMARNLEEPWRSMVRSGIAKTMTGRNMVLPPSNLALCMQGLAHEGFRINLQRYMANILIANTRRIPPLHVPS